ncbi:hypothetical protein CGLO_14268 [Colletotrichum gloeosporioides Cg-14]|uniref:DUF6604 domain-containing protein n=1 Tax=Colletotrichum gloeosporioides (strain Cg-14) TaxID=1237896 RepID=T0L505_COLGC|nr:hypothetical protein CGLO_14268 [Colletotrichum gloeosporioides Cg-14]
MVVPAPLLSLYQQYKQDTNFVAAWLATTAKSCGYPSDLLSEIQAKEESSKPAENKAKGGKGKKKKKQTDQAPKKYTVAVKEFIPLAQYISTAKQKSSNVPDILVSALNRVIDLRTRFSAKLTQDGAKPATASDLKHSYFLGILIQVRDVLRPRMTAAGSQASHNGLDNLANRFAGLSLFEPSQSFLDAPDIELPARDDRALYEADMGTSPEDSIFFFQMLWKDLLDLRMRIRVSWRRHMQGHDMAAAAVSANTALDLARHVIDQYIPAFEGVEGGIYAVMKEHATLMHYRVKANPTDPYFGLLKPGQPQESISDDQIMYGAGLWSFANAYNMLAELLPSIAPPGPPFPFIPRDPAHELGMEYRDYAETFAILKPLFEDLRVVIESVSNWPVPFYLVFATAIISDMHNFFSQGEHLNVDKHIIDKFIETIGAVRGIVADYYAAIREAESLEEMEPYDARIREMDREIKWLLDEDPVWQAKIKKFPRRERGQAKRELEKHRLFKYNAMMCGLALYRYRMILYKTGIAIANVSRSIVCAIHLWDAIGSEVGGAVDFLAGEWVDSRLLGMITEDQAEDFFLDGEGADYNPGYMRNIAMHLGFSIHNFVDEAKTQPRRARLLDGKKGKITERVPMHSAFYDRYVTFNGKTGSENWTFEDVTSLVERASGAGFKPKYPVELIVELATLLEDELLLANLPFLILHAEAFRILKLVRDRCEPMLVPILGPLATPMKAKINVPLVTVWILQALAAMLEGADVLRAAKDVFNTKLVNDIARSSRAYRRIQELGFLKSGEEKKKEPESRPSEPQWDPDFKRKLEQPMDPNRAYESFGLPIDTSRLQQTGTYIDTSKMKGDALSQMSRKTKVEKIYLSDDDEPMEITHTTLSFR